MISLYQGLGVAKWDNWGMVNQSSLGVRIFTVKIPPFNVAYKWCSSLAEICMGSTVQYQNIATNETELIAVTSIVNAFALWETAVWAGMYLHQTILM